MPIKPALTSYHGNQRLTNNLRWKSTTCVGILPKFSHSRHTSGLAIFGLYLLSPYFKERPHKGTLPSLLGLQLVTIIVGSLLFSDEFRMPRRGTAIIAARHFQCGERVDLYCPRAEGTVDSFRRAISMGVNSAVPAGLWNLNLISRR